MLPGSYQRRSLSICYTGPQYAGSDVIIEDLANITLRPLVHKMVHCLHNDYVFTVLAVTTSMVIYSLCNNTMSVFVCYTFI